MNEKMFINKKIRILIAIVTYNGEKDIIKCIESLKSKQHQIDVFVVDNASEDSTISILKGYEPNIIAHFSKKNLGFGQANNIMLKYSINHNYDYVFLLNQDTYFIGDSLDRLIDYAVSNNSIKDVFSPLHLAANEKDLDRNFEVYYNEERIKSSNDNLIKTNFINAAAWLIPIEVVKKIGGFSPLFFHYGEDRDFANRLAFYSGSFIVHKDSMIVHNRVGREIHDIIDQNQFTFRSKINLLRYASDINDFYIFSIFKMFVKGLGEMKKQLFKLNFVSAFMLLKSMGRILLDILKIKRHRDEAKKPISFLS